MYDLTSAAKSPLGAAAPAPDFPEELLNSIPLGVIAVDDDLRVTSINDTGLKALGLQRHRVLGKPCCEILRGSACQDGCPLNRTLTTGESLHNLASQLRHASGRPLPTSVSTAVLRSGCGERIGGVATFQVLPADSGTPRFDPHPRCAAGIIGDDPQMQQLCAVLPTIARTDTSVLVTGETGTGKNILAKAIHDQSPRADRPFVTVNCAALPASLLESELFGYKAGAFTGATRDKPGRFAAAEGGTLFLDEIGDIPLEMQVKLLRVLQEKVYERLGDQRPISCDIRLVTATHHDLEAMVADGSFRRDLYYRINVLNLEIPPLRDRKGDLPRLARHFVDRFARLGRKPIVGLTSAALEILMRHRYPGNVRELENIIEHAWVMCDDHLIDVAHLPRSLRLAAGAATPDQAAGLSQIEGAYLLQVLENNNWHREETARELGMHRTTLQRKIRKLGLVAPDIDGRTSRQERIGADSDRSRTASVGRNGTTGAAPDPAQTIA